MPFDDTMFIKKSVDVLNFFELDQLRQVTPDIIHTKYKTGQMVVMKGEITSGFSIIKNGSVQIFAKDNPKTPITTLQKGDFFGVMSIFSKMPSEVAIKAAEDGTEIIEIPSQSFQKLLEIQPSLKETLLQKVAERMKTFGSNP